MNARAWALIKSAVQALPFTSRWPMDERRFALFGVESAQKVIQYAAAGDVASLSEFLIAERRLTTAWIARGFKFQFPKDLFSDPFHQLRNDTRDFAAKWQFSDEFKTLMGPNN